MSIIIKALSKNGLSIPAGMSQEFIDDSQTCAYDKYNNAYMSNGSVDALETGEESRNIYHDLLPEVQEISKFNSDLSLDMKKYIKAEFLRLRCETMQHAAGNFIPPIVGDKEIESKNTGNASKACSSEFNSPFPQVDRRKIDVRLKRNSERK